jgi:hypothetical protein
MDLVAEVVGALLAFALVTSVLSQLGLGEQARLAGPVVVTVAVSAVLVGALGWHAVSSMVNVGKSERQLSPGEVATERNNPSPLTTGFVDWLLARIPRDGAYYVIGNDGTDDLLNFSLLPRRLVASPQQAQWVIVAGAAQFDAAASGFTRPTYYSPRMGLASRASAG